MIGFRDSNSGNCRVNKFFSSRSSPSTDIDPVGYDCAEKSRKQRDDYAGGRRSHGTFYPPRGLRDV